MRPAAFQSQLQRQQLAVRNLDRQSHTERTDKRTCDAVVQHVGIHQPTWHPVHLAIGNSWYIKYGSRMYRQYYTASRRSPKETEADVLACSKPSSKQQLVHAWTIYSVLIRCFGDNCPTNLINLDIINSKRGFVPWLSWVLQYNGCTTMCCCDTSALCWHSSTARATTHRFQLMRIRWMALQ